MWTLAIGIDLKGMLPDWVPDWFLPVLFWVLVVGAFLISILGAKARDARSAAEDQQESNDPDL